MNFITYYAYDNLGIFTEPVSFDKYGPVPPNSVDIAPPTATAPRVAQWTGAEWVILAYRPVTVQPPEPITEPVIPLEIIVPPIVLSKFEYLKLFTRDERIAIYDIVQTDPIVRDYQYMLDNAPIISLSDSDIKSGVEYLEANGIIGEGRANQILTGPTNG